MGDIIFTPVMAVAVGFLYLEVSKKWFCCLLARVQFVPCSMCLLMLVAYSLFARLVLRTADCYLTS